MAALVTAIVPSSDEVATVDDAAGARDRPRFSLEELDLAGCTALSDGGVALLALLGSGLQSLSLSMCDQVRRAALLRSPPRCATSCSSAQPGLTDAGVCALLRGMPLLSALDLSGCGQLETESVLAVAMFCERLRRLALVRTASACRLHWP